MYGTVARMRAKPGLGAQLEALQAEYDDLEIDGHVATHVYRLDADPDDYYLATIFRDRESYRRNAEDPRKTPGTVDSASCSSTIPSGTTGRSSGRAPEANALRR